MKKTILQTTLAILLSLTLFTAKTNLASAGLLAQQVLFTDDFEKGLATPWFWEDGWGVETVEGDQVLHGAGHIWVTLIGGEDLGEIESFESRINLIKGSLHVNYRLSQSTRYFVRMERGRLSLLKMGEQQKGATELASKMLPLSFNHWYTLRISGVENHLQVFLDDNPVFDYTDEQDPYLSGTIAFESLDDGDVLVDDVVLKGQPLSSSLPDWVFTGGPRGGIGYDIRIDPTNQKILWVTDAYAGAHQSTDGGVNWTARNQGIDVRAGFAGDVIPIFSLTIDPVHPQTIWAGVQGKRGLYKSVDGGQTWVRKDNGIKDQLEMEMRGITVDPTNTDIAYCGGNYLADEATLKQRGFIYKTIDGGENWHLLIEPDALVRWIILDPTDTHIIYASTGIFDRFAVKPTGVLKSLDGGKTWSQINNGFNNLVVAALAMSPKDHLTLLAGTGKAPAFADTPDEIYGGIFITHDGGQSWRQVDPIHTSGRREIRISAVAFAPSNPDILYADAGNEFLRSEDGGETWVRYFVGPALGSGMTENRGTPIALAVLPSDPYTVYMNAYDGGVFVSHDGGKTWEDSSRGYSGAQVWGIALDPQNPAFVVAASKNGVHVSFDAGSTWHGRITEGWINNIESVAVDPQNRDTILIGRSITGEINRSTDGGFTWTTVLGPLGQDMMMGRRTIHRIVFSPSAPTVVFAATGVETISPVGVTRDTTGPGVFKSTDGGVTWAAVNQGLENTTLNILSVAIHPQNPAIVYLGEMNQGVFKTVDGGKTWVPVSNGLLQKEIRALAIDPNHPDTIYAGAEGGGIWKSEDAGGIWKNISSGMSPEASIRSIVVDPVQPGVLYAADIHAGVFRSDNGGGKWQQIRQGLKVKAINGLAISADGKTLYVATEGNGVYRLDVGRKPPAALPEVTIDAYFGLSDSPIKVDGSNADWEGRVVIKEDPAGDAEKGFLDLTNGYAFYDDKALYFLVESPNLSAQYKQLDIQFTVGDRSFICSVDHDANAGYINVTDGSKPIGPTKFSRFAFGPAFEGRIDLRDLGLTGKIQLQAINPMVGDCCNYPAWHSTDPWEVQGPTPSEEESRVKVAPGVTTEQPADVKETTLVQTTNPESAQTPVQKGTEQPNLLLPVLGGSALVILLAVGVGLALRKGKKAGG